MKTYTSPGQYPHTFEIVDSIPEGYFVWNIGIANMGSDHLLPLAEKLDDLPEHEFWINPDTLKAVLIHPDDCKVIMQAAARNINGRTALAKQARQLLKKYM